MRTGKRDRKARKAKAAVEWEAQQGLSVTKSRIEAEEGFSPASRQLARQSRRAGPGNKAAEVPDEGGLTNLEVQAAGGEEGRAPPLRACKLPRMPCR